MDRGWILKEVQGLYERARQECRGITLAGVTEERDWARVNLRLAELEGMRQAYARVIGMLGGEL